MSPLPNFKFSRQIDPEREPCYVTTLPPQNQETSVIANFTPPFVTPRIETPKLPPRNISPFVTPKLETSKLPPRNFPKKIPKVQKRTQPELGPYIPPKLNTKGTPANQHSKSEQMFLESSPRRNSVHFHPNIVTTSSPKKGILKNIGNPNLSDLDHLYEECMSLKNKTRTEEDKHFLHSNIGHFNLNLHEPRSTTTRDSNDVPSSQDKRTHSKKIKKKENKMAACGSPLLGKTDLDKTSPEKKTPDGKSSTSMKYKYNSYEKATKSAKLESVSGVIHLFVIIMCVVITILMTKVNHDWQLLRRRCPLYVKGVASINVYWGNEKNASCNYGAFMPVLIIIISLTLILFHGGVLCSWRHGGNTSKILLSRTYPKIMFFIELFELALLISVASVLTDGFRQTCVGFQMNPWPEYRPMKCKEGFQNRDDAYGISHTYSRILASIIVAWIATIFLMSSVACFLTRSNFRKKK